jgi:hypothetical protein
MPLRGPALLAGPLGASEAAGVTHRYRLHPRWKTFGFPPNSREPHADFWRHAAEPHSLGGAFTTRSPP